MAVDVPPRESTPPPEHVLGVLEDDACREIVAILEEPMTAAEISDETGFALSTVYRKLDRLTDATLVDERTQLRPGGNHRSRYVTNFERISIDLDADREVQVDVARPSTMSRTSSGDSIR